MHKHTNTTAAEYDKAWRSVTFRIIRNNSHHRDFLYCSNRNDRFDRDTGQSKPKHIRQTQAKQPHVVDTGHAFDMVKQLTANIVITCFPVAVRACGFTCITRTADVDPETAVKHCQKMTPVTGI